MPGRELTITSADVNQAASGAWRGVQLAFVGMPPRYVTALTDLGLDTLGDLADRLEEIRLEDFRGIGTAGAGHVRTAVRAWWATHHDLRGGLSGLPNLGA